MPATVNVAGSAHSGTISRLVQCSHSADLMWFCPIRTDSLLTILFSYSANFDAFTEPVSPILVERFRFRDLDSLLGLANTNTQLPCDGDDNDGDDMPGTISVLTKDDVGVNDHEESSSAGTTASGLATKKLRTTLMPATVNVAGSAHSGTISRLVQCSHSADLMWFCPIRTDSLLTILFSYSANFDAFTEPVSPILVERFRFRDLDSLLGLANTNTQLPCDGDDNDGDDMPGTISVLTKDGVGVNDHEESSSAGTTASGLATKKLRVLATPKVVTKCVSGISIFYLNNA
ncbi:hypothetical protein Bca101_047021 [Brassica carinata]